MTRTRPYRIGFLSTVMLGNKNRYRVLRANVERDPTVASSWYPLRSWVDGDWLRVLPGWWRVRIRHLLDSIRLFLPARLDAVVVHAPEMWGVYGTFHALFRRRTLLIDNSDAQLHATGRIGAFLQRRADRRADLFIPWSNYVADDIRRRITGSTPRIVVVSPGVPLDTWSWREPRHRGSGEPLRLLFVGGEPDRKGLDTVLDAFEHHLDCDRELAIATQSRNLSVELAERIERNPQINLHLDLRPDTDELRHLFESADVFVLPTRYDTYGFVLVEALATGIPVVASNVGGIPDIIVDGTTGFLVEPDDPAAVANAVERIARMTDSERVELARAGRRHAEHYHDARTNAGRLLDIVKEEIDARRTVMMPEASDRTRSGGS